MMSTLSQPVGVRQKATLLSDVSPMWLRERKGTVQANRRVGVLAKASFFSRQPWQVRLGRPLALPPPRWTLEVGSLACAEISCLSLELNPQLRMLDAYARF